MVACCCGNELSGAASDAVYTSAGCGVEPPLTAKVSITATLPASHCETYTLKWLVVPPPEEVANSRKRAVPGVHGLVAGRQVDGPQPVGLVVSTAMPVLIG